MRGDLKQRVKTARKRTVSQTRWLERQLNDPYVARAKREGYRSRAAFKLIEIDERFKLLKPGQKIVDLGAAPGGWSQVAAKIVGASGKIVGIDLLPIEPMAGVEFITLDFLDDDAPRQLTDLLGGPADLVLSDMAANTTGHRRPTTCASSASPRPPPSSPGDPGPRRRLSRQGPAGRNRGDAARRPEARLRRGPAREAGGEPGRFERALRAGDRYRGTLGRGVAADE